MLGNSRNNPVTGNIDESAAATPLRCARCGIELCPGRGDFFRVTIEAVADPTPPEISAEKLAEDVRPRIEELLARLEKLTEAELMEQVHCRLTSLLCGPCYRQWIRSPWG